MVGERHEKSEEPFGAASSSLLERITGEEAACVRRIFFRDSCETPAESPDRKSEVKGGLRENPVFLEASLAGRIHLLPRAVD